MSLICETRITAFRCLYTPCLWPLLILHHFVFIIWFSPLSLVVLIFILFLCLKSIWLNYLPTFLLPLNLLRLKVQHSTPLPSLQVTYKSLRIHLSIWTNNKSIFFLLGPPRSIHSSNNFRLSLSLCLLPRGHFQHQLWSHPVGGRTPARPSRNFRVFKIVGLPKLILKWFLRRKIVLLVCFWVLISSLLDLWWPTCLSFISGPESFVSVDWKNMREIITSILAILVVSTLWCSQTGTFP
jgi:hypothetical protein